MARHHHPTRPADASRQPIRRAAARAVARTLARMEPVEARRLMSGTATIVGEVDIYNPAGGTPAPSFYLDQNNNGKLDSGEKTAKSSDGQFQFTVTLPSDTGVRYYVRQVVPAAFKQVNPGPDGDETGGPDGFTAVSDVGGYNDERHVFFTDALRTGTVVGSVKTPHEAGTGIEVYADLNGNKVEDDFEPFAVTGDDSNAPDEGHGYILTDVPIGSDVIIRQALPLPAGYTQVTPASNLGVHVAVAEDQTAYADDFVDDPHRSEIDGFIDFGESAAPSTTVFLDKNNSGKLDAGEASTKTKSDGSFAFTGLALGTYYVRQVVPTGYTVTDVEPTAGGPGKQSAVVTVDDADFPVEASFADQANVVTGSRLLGKLVGTAGSYANNGNTIAKAVDGNLGTVFNGPTANNDYVGYDLLTGRVIQSVAFAPRAGYESRMVGGIFQGSASSSFASPTTLFTITTAPVAGTYTVGTVATTTAFRYVRYLAPANGYGDVAEVAFYGKVAKLTGKTIGTSGSYANNGNTIAKATDGNLSTAYNGANPNGNYVGLDLGAAKVVTGVSFAPRSGYASRMVGGQIQVSTSATFGSGTTTVYTIKAAPATGSLTSVTFASAVSTRYVRYLSANGTYGDIAEFQVFG